jgi:serine/threonine protein kinase
MSNPFSNIFKTGYVLNDKWVIIEFIGKGAMGEVYRVHQLNLKRDVAIKVISREMLASLEDDPEEIETAIQRFRREVQAMAQVRHPKVVQIFDYGSALIHKEDHDIPVEYIAMEYIPGGEVETITIESKDQGQTVQISSFYMDEKMVTNHHFAEFLNEVKKNITVENGIVKNEGEVWLYIGEGTDMKEQIFYKHGRFIQQHHEP